MADVIEKCGITGIPLRQGEHGIRVRVPVAAMEDPKKPDACKEDGLYLAGREGLEWVLPHRLKYVNAQRKRRAEWFHQPVPKPFTLATLPPQYYI